MFFFLYNRYKFHISRIVGCLVHCCISSTQINTQSRTSTQNMLMEDREEGGERKEEEWEGGKKLYDISTK
jgi:hypothetical protein